MKLKIVLCVTNAAGEQFLIGEFSNSTDAIQYFRSHFHADQSSWCLRTMIDPSEIPKKQATV